MVAASASCFPHRGLHRVECRGQPGDGTFLQVTTFSRYDGRLNRTRPYTKQMKQNETGFFYYVRPNFDMSERNVLRTEKDFLSQLYFEYENRCYREIEREKRVGAGVGNKL